MKKRAAVALAIAGVLFHVGCSRSTGESDLDGKVFASLDQVVSEMNEKVGGAIDASHAAAKQAEAIFKQKNGYGKARIDREIYHKDDLGILSDHDHRMESNIYVSKDTPLNDDVQWYIKASEEMIPVWKENIKKYPYLGWQYLTDVKYTSNRFFPWSETTMSMGANVKWREFGFYICVSPENDPSRELKWGRIGTDILGLGLLSSISIPLYVNDQFVAISTVDFLITQTFRDYLFREYPGRNSYFMLVNRKTYQVILRNEKNKGERGWDVMFNYGYLDKLAQEQPENAGLSNRLDTEINGKIDVMVPERKVIYFQKLKDADWVAAIVTERYEH